MTPSELSKALLTAFHLGKLEGARLIFQGIEKKHKETYDAATPDEADGMRRMLDAARNILSSIEGEK